MDLNSIFSKIDEKNIGNGSQKSREWRPEAKLTKIIEESIIKYNENRKQSSPTMFRASGIGDCDRKWAFKEFGEKDEISASSFMVMNLGTSIHELMQDYLADHLVSLEERLYFNEDAGDSSPNEILSGSYDGELDGEILNQKKNILLEIKTTSVDNYQRLLKRQSQLSNKYKLQNNAYLHSKGLDTTIFVFVNRNLGFTDAFKEENKDQLDQYHPIFFEIIYHKEDEKVELIRQKIANRQLAKELKKLPAYKSVSECSYCSFGPTGSGICKTKHLEEKDAKAQAKVDAKAEKKPKKKSV